MGEDGGAPAVAVRRAGDFLFGQAEVRPGSRLGEAGEDRELAGQRPDDIVELRPGRVLPTGSGQGVGQPAPALPNFAFGEENLEVALGPPFVAHQGAVGLGESSHRQDELGPGSGLVGEVVENHHVLGCAQESIHRASVRAAVEVILQDDDGPGFAGAHGLEGFAQRTPAQHRQAGGITFGEDETQPGGTPRAAERPGDVGGRLDDRFAVRAAAGHNERPLSLLQGAGDGFGQGTKLLGQVWNRRGGRIELVGDSEAQPRQVIRGGAIGLRGDRVQAGGVRGGQEKRPFLLLHQFPHGVVLPEGNLELGGSAHRLLADGLAQAEGHARGGIRDILSQDKDRVRELHLPQRGGAGGPFAKNLQHHGGQAMVKVRDALEEPLGADQLAQSEIRFERRAGRPDANRAAAVR